MSRKKFNHQIWKESLEKNLKFFYQNYLLFRGKEKYIKAMHDLSKISIKYNELFYKKLDNGILKFYNNFSSEIRKCFTTHVNRNPICGG